MTRIDITAHLARTKRDSDLIDRLAACLEGVSHSDQLLALMAMQNSLIIDMAGGDEEQAKQIWLRVCGESTAMLKTMMLNAVLT